MWFIDEIMVDDPKILELAEKFVRRHKRKWYWQEDILLAVTVRVLFEVSFWYFSVLYAISFYSIVTSMFTVGII